MSQSTSQKPILRFFIILSGLAFAGTTILGIASLFSNALQEPKDNAQTAVTAKASQLKARERGYEQVLQREPDNQVALQGLVQIRLQTNNLKGAVEPMEKLVKLNPNNAEYKALLTVLKQRAGTSK